MKQPVSNTMGVLEAIGSDIMARLAKARAGKIWRSIYCWRSAAIILPYWPCCLGPVERIIQQYLEASHSPVQVLRVCGTANVASVYGLEPLLQVSKYLGSAYLTLCIIAVNASA